jgi:glycosyltransferase involved in cell wall biosynthesis
MKILMVIPAIGPVYGGTSKIAMELAQALGNLGVHIDLITTDANGASKLNVPLNSWCNEPGFRIRYFPYWQLFGEYKFSSSLTSWLLRHVIDYDIVHINAIFSYPVLGACWACRRHNIPYIIAPHGMLEPWALSYKSHKKRLYYTLLERHSLSHASAIQMTSTPEAANEKVKNLKSAIFIIPNGIHRSEFDPMSDPVLFYREFPETLGKTLIIYLGRIDPKKGLDLLAASFAKVHGIFPNTHLIIAGPDNIGFLPIARVYFESSGCLDAVTFTGMLAGELKNAALAAANIYVAPSYSEGFSMSVLEGMASGLPCVITEGCNFPEASEAKTACVVKIDSNEITNALIDCLQNTDEAIAMGKRARKFIFENYTWDRIALKLISVYGAIINKDPIQNLHRKASK